ncbi:hypothetical protein ACFQ1M_12025 [Sungkyunkwania multivorans]|uniref:Uncharacterized protein n=1 Tax=Sungkyunkwania multivorans TaxID=1173618 RepID=A0ABW3CYP4_9FLAO
MDLSNYDQQDMGQRIVKAELLKDLGTTIEKLTGTKVRLPYRIELVIRDRTNGDKIYLNIQAKPEIDNLKLSEKQLEAIT